MDMPRRLTDEEITAYLDGKAERGVVEAVEAGLVSDDDLVQRVSALDVDRAAIKQAFDRLLPAAPPLNLDIGGRAAWATDDQAR